MGLQGENHIPSKSTVGPKVSPIVRRHGCASSDWRVERRRELPEVEHGHERHAAAGVHQTYRHRARPRGKYGLGYGALGVDVRGYGSPVVGSQVQVELHRRAILAVVVSVRETPCAPGTWPRPQWAACSSSARRTRSCGASAGNESLSTGTRRPPRGSRRCRCNCRRRQRRCCWNCTCSRCTWRPGRSRCSENLHERRSVYYFTWIDDSICTMLRRAIELNVKRTWWLTGDMVRTPLIRHDGSIADNGSNMWACSESFIMRRRREVGFLTFEITMPFVFGRDGMSITWAY